MTGLKRLKMAKRFTDSGKFRDNWYRKLTPNQKCLWEFIISECSLAGIIDIDFDSLEFHIGAKITIEDFEPLNERIYTLPDGKVFIPKFITFQQKELNENNPAHKNIIEILSKYGIDLSLNLENLERGFKGASKGLSSTLGNSNVMVIGNIIGKGTTTKSIVSKKINAPQQEVYEIFAKKYLEMSKQIYKPDKKDFICLADLIKKTSKEQVIQKIEIFERACKVSAVSEKPIFWFTKDGFSCFTIANFIKNYNSITPFLTDKEKEEQKRKILDEQRRLKVEEHFKQQGAM